MGISGSERGQDPFVSSPPWSSAGFGSSRAVGLRTSVLCWLLAGGPPSGPSHMDLSTGQLTAWLCSKWASEGARAGVSKGPGSRTFLSQRSLTSSSLPVRHVLSEVSRGMGSPPGGTLGHLRGCLPLQQTYSTLAVGGNKSEMAQRSDGGTRGMIRCGRAWEETM